jgi:exopolysaccharide biosynthesis polyprenyl glycosylphosphotransferase
MPAAAGRIFAVTHYFFDLVALMIAWRVCVELRILLNPYMPILIPRGRMYALASPPVWLLLLWTAAALWLGSYRARAESSLLPALVRMAESATVLSSLTIVVTFFWRHFGADLSRSFVLLLAPISFLFLVASLFVSRAIAPRIARRWMLPKRIAVLGAGSGAEELVRTISHAADRSVSLRGIIVPEGCAAAVGYAGTLAPAGFAGQSLPVLGTTRELAEVINRESIDRIIVADGDGLTAPEHEYCGIVTRRMGVTVSRPVLSAAFGLEIRHQQEFGLHFIDVQPAQFSHWSEALKRALDVAGSLAAITIMLPVFALVAALIRVTSSGPIFYVSRRVGKGGRHFTFLKFRSMYTDGPTRASLAASNEGNGHLFKIRRDPRVTPVGRVLRRLSLDELPQLLNVLAGDMSLVGPRPLPIEDLSPDGMSDRFSAWAEARAAVRPGITGLWQISGRSDAPFESMIRLDMDYIRDWSFASDLRILLATPAAVLGGRGAY